MHITFGFIGQLVIDDVSYIVDVNSTRSDVGCDKHPRTSFLEIIKRTLPGILGLVAVKGLSANAIAHQVFHHPIRATLGAREHNNPLKIWRREQFGQTSTLCSGCKVMNPLFNSIDRNTFRRNFHPLGFKQNLTCEPSYLLWHRRGEQQGLTLVWQLRNDATHIVDEPHIKHAISLVEN